MPARPTGTTIAALVALIFGAMTLFGGGTALFGGEMVQEAVGEAVPFILWFNFAAGFAYVLAGWGLWTLRPWAAWLSGAICLATLGILLAFLVHVLRGGGYELRTLVALPLRAGVWAAIFATAWRS